MLAYPPPLHAGLLYPRGRRCLPAHPESRSQQAAGKEGGDEGWHRSAEGRERADLGIGSVPRHNHRERSPSSPSREARLADVCFDSFEGFKIKVWFWLHSLGLPAVALSVACPCNR